MRASWSFAATAALGLHGASKVRPSAQQQIGSSTSDEIGVAVQFLANRAVTLAIGEQQDQPRPSGLRSIARLTSLPIDSILVARSFQCDFIHQSLDAFHGYNSLAARRAEILELLESNWFFCRPFRDSAITQKNESESVHSPCAPSQRDPKRSS